MEILDTEKQHPLLLSQSSRGIDTINIFQALASDILVLIVETLSNDGDELYAPLICSHVCRYWRKTITDAPCLWTYVDTSRGTALTRLWLTNAKNAKIKVRLWDRSPHKKLYKHMIRYLFHRENWQLDTHTAAGEVMREAHRWRSLDIASPCLSRVSEVVTYLGRWSKTLMIDSLTIGPMGRTVLVVDDSSVVSNPTGPPPLADFTAAQSLFQKMNVRPAVLHVDTYPVAFSPIIFSQYLTTLEVYTGNHYTHLPDVVEWHQILSHTPQLTRLCLWSPRHRDVTNGDLPTTITIKISALEHLELTGAFITLSSLFVESPLPRLDYLLLDFLGVSIDIPGQLARFGLVSPALTQLYIGSMSFSLQYSRGEADKWGNAFRSLGSLQTLTLAEMEWREAANALRHLRGLSYESFHVELREIWDMDMSELNLLLEIYGDSFVVQVTDCVEAKPGRCVNPNHSSTCSSEAGSNYSDNESFTWERGCPSSVLDSEGSEISYGESEGENIGEHIKN